jgi:hypothetical protein
MSWYELLRLVHSYWRWAVLLSAGIALARASEGTWRGRQWARADERAARLFIRAIDIQFLLGVVLYFGFSPFWTATYYSFSETMRDQGSRFFGIEHQTAMVLAITAAHVAWHRVRRASNTAASHRTLLIGLLVFFAFALWAIPWPWRPYGRPLFRTEW